MKCHARPSVGGKTMMLADHRPSRASCSPVLDAGETDPRKGTKLIRVFLASLALTLFLFAGNLVASGARGDASHGRRAIPIIDVTDLYHPPQDVGDNFDLVSAYALPEIDLRAVILDAHDSFRKPISDHPLLTRYGSDKAGPRDPGFIPVLQLNYIFNRNVPAAVGPFTMMKSPQDKMLDIPAFQQQGVELILKVLRESKEPVSILSFGSARPIAVAYNRDPKLFHEKVKQIHLSAGASSPDFLEWNVGLDPNAVVCLLRSDLPIAIYPCAVGEKEGGAFGYGPHNTFYKTPNAYFIKQMDPRLRRYMAYAFGRVNRSDFLRAMDEDFPDELTAKVYSQPHNVWETGTWALVSNRRLVRRADGHYRMIPAQEVRSSDKVMPNDLRPCLLKVSDDGIFTFEHTDRPSNFLMYDRGDPHENEKAFTEALIDFYISIRP